MSSLRRIGSLLKKQEWYPTRPRLALLTTKKGLTLEEAISLANENHAVILSNKSLEKYFQSYNEANKPRITTWTGTLIAYVTPTLSFLEVNPKDRGKYVVYTDPKTDLTYEFPVPKKFRNSVGALVIEHGFDKKGRPFFEIRTKGKIREILVRDESKIKLMDMQEDIALYNIDDKFLFPTINAEDSDSSTRFLCRAEDSPMITLIARDWIFSDDVHPDNDVYADSRPSSIFAVLVLDKTKTRSQARPESIRPVSPRTEKDLTTLFLAIYQNNIPVLNKTLKHGNVNTMHYGYVSPLHYATLLLRKEIIVLLLKKGANVNIKAKDGTTPLHYAALMGNLEILALLIKKGANVNARNKDGRAPLHLLMYHDASSIAGVAEAVKPTYKTTKESVALLLENGAEVNIKDNDGNTPLHYAASAAYNDMVALLIRNGANPTLKNKSRETPLDVAKDHNNEKTAALLLRYLPKKAK